jgi:flagellar protein FlaI
MLSKIVKNYKITLNKVAVGVSILKEPDKYVQTYLLKLPEIGSATLAFLEEVRDKLITAIPIKIENLRNPSSFGRIKNEILEKAEELIKEGLPSISEESVRYASLFLANEMIGLGNIEFLLDDPNLEEIVINNSREPVWVYHKKEGWLITNVVVNNEEQIKNYASIIGRRIGKQITTLEPLMDAHLLTGDRVNATIFPISTKGNTITIRKFRRKPWTITDFIENKTIDYETAALVWLCVQYELSVIIGGGTASGKTSFLNTILPFVPPNQRIVSIEETRELNLPKFLHWVPLTTREPNPEGKGEVNMLDLLINSLRMRPDRIVVGEVRRQPEAEVLFEALNTGHSVYSTLHANTAEEAFRRLTSPPINLPKDLIKSLPLFAIMFRQRRKNIRRLFELTEVGDKDAKLNELYKWNPKEDMQIKVGNSKRLVSDLTMFTGMTREDMDRDIQEKIDILKWMVKNRINTIDTVGKAVSEYYSNKKKFLKNVKSQNGVKAILGDFYSELGG